MSRIGKLPIEFANDIQVNMLDDTLTVKGPKGELTQAIHPDVELEIKEGLITVKPKKDTSEAKALWGLFRSLINNMVHGVKEGYKVELEINGTGYKAANQNGFLVLSLGYSHDIFVEIADDLKVEVKKNLISVSGVNKQKVGQFAAEVRALRKPEPYKGKGVKYLDEVIIRKEGKKK